MKLRRSIQTTINKTERLTFTPTSVVGEYQLKNLTFDTHNLPTYRNNIQRTVFHTINAHSLQGMFIRHDSTSAATCEQIAMRQRII